MITGHFLRRSRPVSGLSSSAFRWNDKDPTNASSRTHSTSSLHVTRRLIGPWTVNTTTDYKTISFGRAAAFSSSAAENKLQDNQDETTTSFENQEDSRKTYSKYQPRPWMDYYRALAQFHKEHGHSNVQKGTITDPALVYFVKKQRRNRDILTHEQIERLNALDFDWETRAQKQERIWHQRYQELVEYKQQNGHCDCPTRYLPNRALGRWVDRQRRLHKNGDLSDHRVELLDKIGFSWPLVEAPIRDTPTLDKRWRKQFQKLVDHVHRHGNCVVPSRKDEYPSLGNWVRAQRGLERKGLLRPDRKRQLQEIGFVFDIDKTNPNKSILQQQWDEMFNYLLEFKEEKGHVNVPHAYKEKEGLGGWIAHQRKREKEGKLEAIRRERLLEVGFKFGESREEKWQRNFDEWQEFYERHGHDPARSDDPYLSSWVFFQRSLYHEGKLSEDRRAKLESVGFVWKVRNR